MTPLFAYAPNASAKLGSAIPLFQVYGFFYEEFKPDWFFWQSIAQLQTLIVRGCAGQGVAS